MKARNSVEVMVLLVRFSCVISWGGYSRLVVKNRASVILYDKQCCSRLPVPACSDFYTGWVIIDRSTAEALLAFPRL